MAGLNSFIEMTLQGLTSHSLAGNNTVLGLDLDGVSPSTHNTSGYPTQYVAGYNMVHNAIIGEAMAPGFHYIAMCETTSSGAATGTYNDAYTMVSGTWNC